MTAEKDVQVARKKTFFLKWGVPLSKDVLCWPFGPKRPSVSLFGVFGPFWPSWPCGPPRASGPLDPSVICHFVNCYIRTPGHPYFHCLFQHQAPTYKQTIRLNPRLAESNKRRMATAVFVSWSQLKEMLTQPKCLRTVVSWLQQKSFEILQSSPREF